MRRPGSLTALALVLTLRPTAGAVGVKVETANLQAGNSVGGAGGAVNAGISRVPVSAGTALLGAGVSMTAPGRPSGRASELASEFHLPASALVVPAAAHDGLAPKPGAVPRAPVPASESPIDAEAAAAPAVAPAYARQLTALGVPEELISRLVAFAAANRGPNGPAYASQAAAMIREDSALSKPERVLLLIAAVLRDSGAERLKQADARSLIADLAGAQIGAARLQGVLDASFKEYAAPPRPGDEFELVWGRRLSYLSQVSPYLGDVAKVEERLRRVMRRLSGQFDAMSGKSEEQAVAEQRGRLAERILQLQKDPVYPELPADFQMRLFMAHMHFSDTPEATLEEDEPKIEFARGPPSLEDARKYVASMSQGTTPSAKLTDDLVSHYFESGRFDPNSPEALEIRRTISPERVRDEDALFDGLPEDYHRRRALILKISRDHNLTPRRVAAAAARRGLSGLLRGASDKTVDTQFSRMLLREQLQPIVDRYPNTAQGRFMRKFLDAMLNASGNSVEEVARDGAFAYVRMIGPKVISAEAGRDPDKPAQTRFYITRKDDRWHIAGSLIEQRPGAARRRDEEVIGHFKEWLIEGGIPPEHLASGD